MSKTGGQKQLAEKVIYRRQIPVSRARHFALRAVNEAFQAAESVSKMLDLCSIEETLFGEIIVRWDYLQDTDVVTIMFYPDGSISAQILDSSIPDWVDLEGGLEEIIDHLVDRLGLQYL